MQVKKWYMEMKMQKEGTMIKVWDVILSALVILGMIACAVPLLIIAVAMYIVVGIIVLSPVIAVGCNLCSACTVHNRRMKMENLETSCPKVAYCNGKRVDMSDPETLPRGIAKYSASDIECCRMQGW